MVWVGFAKLFSDGQIPADDDISIRSQVIEARKI